MMKKPELPSCKFNHGVACIYQDPCEHCGWNPEEEQRRNDALVNAVENTSTSGLLKLNLSEVKNSGNSDI